MGSTPMSRHSRGCMSRQIAWQGISGLMGDMGMESLSSDWAMQQASTRVAKLPQNGRLTDNAHLAEAA